MREGGAELPGRIRDLVAEEMQMSASKLARLEAIGNNLKFPGFADAWKDGRLSESVAYEISKLPMDKQADVWDGMISEGKTERTLTARDVERLSADDAGAARVPDAVFNSDTNGETIPQSAARPLTAPPPSLPPAAASLPAGESLPFTQGSLKWRRCLVDEPEEGQLVLVVDPDIASMPDVCAYLGGQFVDGLGRGDAMEVKSFWLWLPLPPFPWEEDEE